MCIYRLKKLHPFRRMHSIENLFEEKFMKFEVHVIDVSSNE